MKQLAVDWITAIVTREQYENAKATTDAKQPTHAPSELDAEIERTLDAAEGWIINPNTTKRDSSHSL